MGKASPYFPDNVWDGTSPSRVNPERHDRHPDWEDWDQVVAEVQAVESSLTSASGSGSTALNTISASDAPSSGVVHSTTLTLASVVMNTTDDATHGAFGSAEVYDFPTGNILVLGASGVLTVDASSGGVGATAAVVLGVGTSAAAQSSGDGTLAATEANIAPSTAFTLTSGAKTATNIDSTAVLAANGHASAKKAYLNAQIPTAGSSAAGSLTVSGTLTITWVQLTA